MYALIENDTIVRTVTKLRKEFPNISFPSDEPEQYEGWHLVKTPDLPEGKVLTGDIELVGGEPYYTYTDRPSEDFEIHLDQYREQQIAKGFTTPQGITVQGDDRTQLRLTGARIEADKDPNYTVKWKAASGEVLLDAPSVIALSEAMRAHVQNHFDAYFSAREDIGGMTTLEDAEAAFDAALNAIVNP